MIHTLQKWFNNCKSIEAFEIHDISMIECNAQKKVKYQNWKIYCNIKNEDFNS